MAEMASVNIRPEELHNQGKARHPSRHAPGNSAQNLNCDLPELIAQMTLAIAPAMRDSLQAMAAMCGG